MIKKAEDKTPASTNKKKKAVSKRKPRKKEIIKINTTVEERELMQWLNSTGKAKELTEPETLQFLKIAQAYNLNPFKNEIFCTVYSKDDPAKRTLSIVIGYRAFIKRAEKVHILDGWTCITSKEDNDLKAVCTIYRKDWQFPFVHEAWYKECVQMKYTKSGSYPNAFWNKMPKFMLKKVCTAQAFRLCFPDEDMPYIEEEDGEIREYELPIGSVKKDDFEGLEYKQDEKKIDTKEEKTNIPAKEKLKKFINENQQKIMKIMMPSSLFEEAKGKTEEEIEAIINRVKEKLEL